MPQPSIDRLRSQIGGPRDGGLLRYSLARALLDAGEVEAGLAELRQALRFDPDYSAAWKLYGQTLASLSRNSEASAAFTSGIEVAARRGDVQAQKEMQVFLKRLQQAAG